MVTFKNPPKPDPSRSRRLVEEEIYLKMLRAVQRIDYAMQPHFEKHRITHQQYNVLRILFVRGQEGLPISEISQRLVTRVPDMTRLIDRMEKTGLVGREPSTSDRRVVLIHSTDKGERIRKLVDELVEAEHERQFAEMDKDDVRQLDRLLSRFLGERRR